MKGKHNRGVAQLASASGLGPEGPVFESQYPDNVENDYLKSSGRFFVVSLREPLAHNSLTLSVLYKLRAPLLRHAVSVNRSRLEG